MPRQRATTRVAVPMRRRNNKRETSAFYKITTFSGPIIEAGGAAILSDIDWEPTRDLWDNIQAPLAKLEKIYDFLKHGIAIEFLRPKGDMITYIITDEIVRFDKDKSFVRYYLCLHCSILQINLGNGYPTKQHLKTHIDSIHRYQPTLVYRCSCEKTFEHKSELLEHRKSDCLLRILPDELLIPAAKMNWNDESYWTYTSVRLVYPYTAIPIVPVTTPQLEQADEWLEKVRSRISKNKTDDPPFKWAETIWVPQYQPTKDQKTKFKKLISVDANGEVKEDDFVVPRFRPFDKNNIPIGTIFWDKKVHPVHPVASTSASGTTGTQQANAVEEGDYEDEICNDNEPNPVTIPTNEVVDSSDQPAVDNPVETLNVPGLVEGQKKLTQKQATEKVKQSTNQAIKISSNLPAPKGTRSERSDATVNLPSIRHLEGTRGESAKNLTKKIKNVNTKKSIQEEPEAGTTSTQGVRGERDRGSDKPSTKDPKKKSHLADEPVEPSSSTKKRKRNIDENHIEESVDAVVVDPSVADAVCTESVVKGAAKKDKKKSDGFCIVGNKEKGRSNNED